MLNKFTIDDFPVLQLEHVYMKDKAFVINVINEILHGGVNHLQVVTDFDLTITKQHVNGTRGLSSFGVFEKCTQLPKSFKEESTKLYFKYRPIEIDPILSLEEKIEAMENWMIATNDLLNGIEFDPHELDDIVKLYATELRDGTNELFQKLNISCVPVLVFSAGLGDVVQAILRHYNILFDNVTVISNFLKYNGNKLAGLKNEKSLHVFNKNEHTLDEEHLKLLEGKQNVLLMGDSLGDANMVDGMDNVKNVLKIGFLYDHVEKSLDSYMNAFDIVLVDDQSMRVVDDILKHML